ncbi:MAG: crossover junction endodeoxyribonuclease RuvC [Candidatus Zambryskibacteria bacterium]|nr:crossover junction endodeoxyribonuclease RuvC [Candidatus Zambryskibacteria bacterium]
MLDSRFMIHDSIILGIDPGYGRMGIAIIKKERSKDILLHSECFETNAQFSHSGRLFLIGKNIEKIIKKHKPNQIAVETLLWSKNKKTALQVAEARGVILFLAAKYKILLREFNPNQVKLAITGYGKSDKRQVKNMVEKLVKIKSLSRKQKRYDDEYDAIAIALTGSAILLSTENPL